MTNKSFILTIASFLLLATSCKKDLDLRPTDSVEEGVAFNNVAALQKGLNAVYSRYASARAHKSYISSIVSDEAKFGHNNGGSGQFAYRWQYNSDPTSGSDVTAGMTLYYSVIDQANRVLAASETVPVTGAVEIAQRDSIRGQALALRGTSHFELLEQYSKKYDPNDPLGVTIMTKSCLSCYLPRNTMAEVIAQVEKDLTDAKALVGAPTVPYNDLKINAITVTAFQARVALYKGEWQKAADFATTVINSNVKTLAVGSAFNQIWTDDNTNELIFRLRLELSPLLGGQWTSQNGNVIFSPSDKLAASYTTSDIRSTAYIGVGTKTETNPGNGVNAGGRYVKKFSISSRGGSVVDVKAVRIAEMYLIRAEARAELNDLAGASADINELRSKRIASYVPVTFTDKTVAINEIMLERYKELAFEGFRLFDLKRRSLPVQRLASDVDSPLWQTLPADNFRFVFPIPASEMLANPNAKQNKDY